MSPERLRQLLAQVAAGEVAVETAMERLRRLPFEELGELSAFARIDHHRETRTGFPEVVFGAGKSLPHLVHIVSAQRQAGSRVLVTRLDPATAAALIAEIPGGRHEAEARAVVFEEQPPAVSGLVVVLSGGTSDIPVAAEAAVVARSGGARVETVYDVGVAGLHRLLSKLTVLHQARAIVVVAGMEGALPSVVGGLVAAPVIAVPTSVGYGASFGGLAALLAMLNTCAPGVAVVNIDNGFGAGYLAAMINRTGGAGVT